MDTWVRLPFQAVQDGWVLWAVPGTSDLAFAALRRLRDDRSAHVAVT